MSDNQEKITSIQQRRQAELATLKAAGFAYVAAGVAAWVIAFYAAIMCWRLVLGL